MFFNCHTTTRAERERLLKTPFQEIEIDPKSFHTKQVKPIVWEEDSEDFYEHDINDFLDILARLDRGHYDWQQSDYFRKWKYKGAETYTRLNKLSDLYNDIKSNGIIEPVHCEITGERIDGSFRTKIAIHLGIDKLKARLYRFNWRDISEHFIVRKLMSREMSYGKDYYEFEYGYKDWKNVKAGPNYRENAERWKDIIPLIKGDTVLDVGCNEGYIGIQASRAGKKVVGIDHEWINLCYLNKLIFEWIDKKDLDIEFYEEDIRETKRTADTI
jgi:2-polyprenyl-3-methyl-5-hydroxy-6-metoxy-1,4-benzoquinol methylase